MMILFTCFQPGVCTWQWGQLGSQAARPRQVGGERGDWWGYWGVHVLQTEVHPSPAPLGNDQNIGQRKELWKEEFCGALS
jgi:hypothetical protein